MSSHIAGQGSSKLQIQIAIKPFEEELTALKRISFGCHDCEKNQNRGEGYCSHWKQTVPPDARAAGCDQWTFDEIPF